MKFKLSEKAAAAMDKVLEQFKTGDLSPVIQCARITPDPADTKPATKWTTRNRILAYLTTGDLDCRGFKQWKKVGRHVKKREDGGIAGYILGPIKVWITDDETNEKRQIVVGYTSIAVFGVSATEGEALPVFDYTPPEPPALTDLAESLGIETVYLADLPNDSHGDYNPETDKIRIGTHDPRTFWHELGHAMHNRIEKRAGNELQGGQDPMQETIAELTGCVLAQLYAKRDQTGNAWQYISKYSEKPMLAITGAVDTVSSIMAEIETMQTEIDAKEVIT